MVLIVRYILSSSWTLSLCESLRKLNRFDADHDDKFGSTLCNTLPVQIRMLLRQVNLTSKSLSIANAVMIEQINDTLRFHTSSSLPCANVDDLATAEPLSNQSSQFITGWTVRLLFLRLEDASSLIFARELADNLR